MATAELANQVRLLNLDHLQPGDSDLALVERLGSNLTANIDSDPPILETEPDPETGISLKQKSDNKDQRGNRHTRMDEWYMGVPVFYYQAIRHQRGAEIEYTGKFIFGIKEVIGEINATDFNSTEVVDFLKTKEQERYNETNGVVGNTPRLVQLGIYVKEITDDVTGRVTGGQAYLAWDVELWVNTECGPASPRYKVDARNTIDILNYFNNLQTEKRCIGEGGPGIAVPRGIGRPPPRGNNGPPGGIVG